MANIKQNILYNVSYRVFQLVLPLVTAPYISRVLGAKGVGLFSYTNAIATYFLLFAMLGISTHGVRAIAAVSHQAKNKLYAKFWSLYLGQLIMAVASLSVYLLIGPLTSADIEYYLWLPLLISGAFDCSWYLFGTGEFRIPTLINYLVQLITTISIFVFVRTIHDVGCYIIISSISSFASALLIAFCVFNKVRIRKVAFSAICFELKKSFGLFIPAIAVNVYTSIDKVMLGQLSGMAENGLYTYADKLVSIITAVLAAFCTVLLPTMTELYSSRRDDDAFKLLDYSLWIMQAISWGLFTGLFVCADTLVPLFLGIEYLACVPALRVLSLRIPILGVTYVLGNQFLLPKGFDNIYTKAVYCGAFVDLALNLVSIRLLGGLGASISTVLAEAIVLIVEWRFVSKNINSIMFSAYLLEYAFVSLMTIFFSAGVCYFVAYFVDSILIKLIVNAISCLLFYLVLGIMISNRLNNSYIEKLVLNLKAGLK